MNIKLLSGVAIAALAISFASCSGKAASADKQNATEAVPETPAAPSVAVTPPSNVEPGKAYAAVVVTGADAAAWYTDSMQAKYPAYVISTPDAAKAVATIDSLADANLVNIARLYVTGPEAASTLAAYPARFAAALIVGDAPEEKDYDALTSSRFIYFASPTANVDGLKAALEKAAVHYTYASWSATLPQSRQNELAATMLEKGAPVNIFQFEDGATTTTQAAYGNAAAVKWLFSETK